MKNKIFQIISVFLLASMVVPIIVEGVELSRDHSAAVQSPFTTRVSEQDLLYLDTAARHAYDAPPQYTAPYSPQPKMELPTLPQL